MPPRRSVPSPRPMRRSQRRPQLPSHPANKNRQSNLDLLAEIERGEHVHDREGEDCDIHIYESRRNTRGEQVVLRAGIQSKTPFEEDRSYHVGFVLTRYFSSLKELISTSFEVRSPFAQQALRQVIKDYPNVDINTTGRIIIEDQPQCLFHYRKELLEYAETAKDRRVKEHVNLCLHYMETVLSRELKAFKIGVTNATTTPGLTHKDLWMVLKPGTLMYMTQDDSIRLSRLRFLEWQDLIGQAPKWILTLEVIECDGNKFGCTSRDYNIMSYDGIKSFINLTTFPLKYHPAEAQIRKEVLARGNKFISFGGVHYREYIGKAIFFGNPYPPFSSEPIEVKERIILDCTSGRRNYPNLSITISTGSKIIPCTPEAEVRASMTEEDLLVCHPSWPGFALESKRWGMFQVDKIRKVSLNSQAFHSLALPPDKKNLISSLVSFQGALSEYESLISGKGKGLILLHGPPGVGKTFTAESIADHTERPLYRLDSGQLSGFNAPFMEANLIRALSLAQKWGAVVLLDEADVFMQQRGLQDLKRNSVVSLLLKHLEHFEGILFLTTNRVETIDSAFQSRIHLSISYPPLSIEYKRKLWEDGLERSNGKRPRWLTAKLLDGWARSQVNGREIQNIIRMAHALAFNEKRPMKISDVQSGVDALELFNADRMEGSTGQRRVREEQEVNGRPKRRRLMG